MPTTNSDIGVVMIDGVQYPPLLSDQANVSLTYNQYAQLISKSMSSAHGDFEVSYLLPFLLFWVVLFVLFFWIRKIKKHDYQIIQTLVNGLPSKALCEETLRKLEVVSQQQLRVLDALGLPK